jgi:hypothetical protein
VKGDVLWEFLDRCKRDPVFFVNALLVRKTRAEIDGFKVRHKGQEDWLRNSNQPINVLVPGNRFGKSTVEAMKHLWKGFTKDGFRGNRADWMAAPYETISVSVSADQAGIVYGFVKELARSPAFAPFVVRTRETPFPHVVLWNGSIIHCRSAHDDGKYIDGHGYQYVSVDEAGWVPRLKKLMNGVIIMRLAGGGMIDLIGTPKGYTDLYWYANRGLRGVPGYYTQRGSIYDNPYLSAEDLKIRDELLAQADPRLREQVLYGSFVSDTGMAFTQDQLDQCFVEGMPAHQDAVRERKYVQAWDLGRRTDYTVGVTFDVTEEPYRMVDFVRLNKVPWEHIYDLIRRKAVEYSVHMPVIDATGPGGDVIEEELTKRGLFVDAVRTESLSQKTNLVNTLQSALDYGRQAIGVRVELDEAGFPRQVPDMEPTGGKWGLIRMPPIPQLLDEFGGYELDDKKLVQDCVMSVALAIGSVYDGSVLDRPVEGGLYGGGTAVETIGQCGVCERVFPVGDLGQVNDAILRRMVQMCQNCYDIRHGAGVAA